MREGFPNIIPHSIIGPRDRVQQFLNKVDIRKGPIERTVRTIVRLRAPDYDSPKQERKEFIYYIEDWEGNDWRGHAIRDGLPQEHIEGKYIDVLTRPVFDERTGEHIDNAFDKTRIRYYIPWSKKNVDEIIANSAHSNKDSIRYVIKFSAEDSDNGAGQGMRNQFSYDMFVNWSWDKIYEWQTWPWEEMTQRPSASPKKSANKLEFKPS